MEDITLNEHNKQEYPPMHTAEHILNRTMVNMFGCKRSIENHIERKKSKCHYLLDSEPSADQIKAVEDKVNEIISQNLDVRMDFVNKNNVPKDVSLDSLPDNASETLRLVYVGDYDVCACVGSHVKNTNEIGEFRISSHSFTDGKLRIVFRLKNE